MNDVSTWLLLTIEAAEQRAQASAPPQCTSALGDPCTGGGQLDAPSGAPGAGGGRPEAVSDKGARAASHPLAPTRTLGAAEEQEPELAGLVGARSSCGGHSGRCRGAARSGHHGASALAAFGRFAEGAPGGPAHRAHSAAAVVGAPERPGRQALPRGGAPARPRRQALSGTYAGYERRGDGLPRRAEALAVPVHFRLDGDEKDSDEDCPSVAEMPDVLTAWWHDFLRGSLRVAGSVSQRRMAVERSASAAPGFTPELRGCSISAPGGIIISDSDLECHVRPGPRSSDSNCDSQASDLARFGAMQSTPQADAIQHEEPWSSLRGHPREHDVPLGDSLLSSAPTFAPGTSMQGNVRQAQGAALPDVFNSTQNGTRGNTAKGITIQSQWTSSPRAKRRQAHLRQIEGPATAQRPS
ncbi:unnamed protein product [Prorocentrum cordatum]|uniref:Uncharacterized protein n=1 Tax=Prorocentrum cordatum TaxID=2364126 RepID=A0ABN9RY72_9DINO|nr:unnamed protein product [Polarella glacialis]